MSASSATPAGAVGAPPAAPPPPPPKSGHGGAIAALVVVIVIIVLIVGLGFANVVPGFHLGSSKSSGPAAKTFNVTFTETGLSAGAAWGATIGGSSGTSTGTTLVLAVPNGTYSYSVSAAGYSASPASGTVVVNGNPVPESVTFTALPPGTYQVTFTESGLVTATSWGVTFNGTPMTSTTSTIVFSSGNGMWSYTVGTVTGYTASPASGSVTVNGADTGATITFTKVTGSGSQMSYGQAAPLATSAASGQGGTWTLVLAVGLSSTVAYSNSTSGNSTCTISGGTETFGVPAWTGAYANGYQSVWAFEFYQNVSGSPEALLIAVADGSATIVGTETGECATGFSFLAVPSDIIDSTAVAADIAANDSAYLAANPEASSEFFVYGGFSFEDFMEPAYWIVAFTTCAVGSTSGMGNNFTAEVNATSGVVIGAGTSSGACDGSFVPHVGNGSASSTELPSTDAAVLRGD